MQMLVGHARVSNGLIGIGHGMFGSGGGGTAPFFDPIYTPANYSVSGSTISNPDGPNESRRWAVSTNPLLVPTYWEVMIEGDRRSVNIGVVNEAQRGDFDATVFMGTRGIAWSANGGPVSGEDTPATGPNFGQAGDIALFAYDPSTKGMHCGVAKGGTSPTWFGGVPGVDPPPAVRASLGVAYLAANAVFQTCVTSVIISDPNFTPPAGYSLPT